MAFILLQSQGERASYTANQDAVTSQNGSHTPAPFGLSFALVCFNEPWFSKGKGQHLLSLGAHIMTELVV